MKKQQQINVKAYKAAGFIGKYQKLVTETVIPYQHSILWDRAEGAEKSHVAANFINAAKALRGEDTADGFYGRTFQDSDAAKWIEAAAYSLAHTPDPALEAKVDEMIDLVAAAQDEDGYLDTRFTIKDRDKRWKDLFEGHELYCSGHFVEAACAYYEATGKDKLLKVMLKNIDHIYDVFTACNPEGFPGHPEIELALMKLYRLSGNEHALKLCECFIERRGRDPEFFVKETEKRKWSLSGMDPRNNEYLQNTKPLRELSDAEGHAVRAVYLYTGMADLASETGDEELLEACRRLWDSIVNRRMHVTGGIGSADAGEAFTVDYDLPPDTTYNETCASAGLIFFASRMLENEISGKYADIMELAFYNTLLAGMQLDGKSFFYVNPLQADPGITGKAVTHQHVISVRPKWYDCACCPPNVARTIESFGRFAYGENDATAYCHLYAAGEVDFANGLHLCCETGYPYDMTVRYKVSGKGRLAVRVPAWSRQFTLSINGEQAETESLEGYVYKDVRDGDELVFEFDGTPVYIRASNKVPALAGMIAVKRGPLVYCFEGVDNGCVRALRLDRSTLPEIAGFDDKLGAVTLRVRASRAADCDGLYSAEPEASEPCEAIAVPYYTWANRGENEMRVWMP